MIGQTIESRPLPPLGVILWLLVALALDVLAVVQGNVDVAVGSLFPWLTAALLWRVRERPFVARFTETALEVDEPPLAVPYAELQGLWAPRRPANPFKAGPRSYTIHVIHAGGVLRVPARLTVRSDEVYSFLFGRFSLGGSRDIPAPLLDYLRRKERAYGAQRVWSYRARTHLGLGLQTRSMGAFFLALLLSGIAWLVWGIVRGVEGWIVGSIFAVFLGGLFTWIVWLAGRRPMQAAGLRRWRRSGLVISPDGLALVQGDLVGEMRWDELREVKIIKGSGLGTVGSILLKVEGAAILIADVYDRPLALIYQHICHYRKGPSHEDDEDRASSARVLADRPLPRSSEGITPE